MASDLVQIGSPSTALLAPETTLPNLLCHTITDGELDLLTDKTATVMGGLCTTAFGVMLGTVVPAWPAIAALRDGQATTATAQDYVYLVVLSIALTAFVICGVLSGMHESRKAGKVSVIRARRKVPIKMASDI